MSSTSLRSSSSEESYESVEDEDTTQLVCLFRKLNVQKHHRNVFILCYQESNTDIVEDVVEYTDVPLCRICWLDGSIDELTSLPCKCQGTVVS